MRLFELLKEAPITDYSYQGPEEPVTFDRQSTIKTATSPKAKEKAMRAFQNTPWKIRILFLNAEKPTSARVGYPALPREKNGKTVNYWMGNITGADFPGTPGEITFVINSDDGDNFKPFTPWMIAHRLGHALAFSADKGKLAYQSRIGEVLPVVRKKLDEIMRVAYNDGSKESEHKLIHFLGKFRSARNNEISTTGEFVIESLAQFLIQNKVSFNHFTGEQLSPTRVNVVNKMIDDFAAYLNKEFKIVMDSMVGKVVAI